MEFVWPTVITSDLPLVTKNHEMYSTNPLVKIEE